MGLQLHSDVHEIVVTYCVGSKLVELDSSELCINVNGKGDAAMVKEMLLVLM